MGAAQPQYTVPPCLYDSVFTVLFLTRYMCVWSCVSVCVHVNACGSQKSRLCVFFSCSSPSFYETGSLTCPRSSVIQLDWLPCECQRLAGLCLLNTGIIHIPHNAQFKEHMWVSEDNVLVFFLSPCWSQDQIQVVSWQQVSLPTE